MKEYKYRYLIRCYRNNNKYYYFLYGSFHGFFHCKNGKNITKGYCDMGMQYSHWEENAVIKYKYYL